MISRPLNSCIDDKTYTVLHTTHVTVWFKMPLPRPLYRPVSNHAVVALGDGGQQDPGGQVGGEGAAEGGEARAQLSCGRGRGGGRRGRLY